MKRAALCLSIFVMVGLILPQDLGGNPPPPDEGAFTYMGELHRLGESYTGTADFRFTLWDAPTDGAPVAPMQARSKLIVSDGLFQARLRFDETTFDGEARWLEIEVRTPSGEGRFTTLSPRQQIVSSRHDLRDVNADEAGDEGGDESVLETESDQAGSDVRAGDGASSLRQDRSSSVLRDGSSVGPDGIPTMLRRADSLGDDGIRIASDSPWQPDSNGIHYKVANVGIGTNAASSSRLSVRGDRAIFGRSDSRRGRGVYGLANKTTGPNFGVYGQSKSNRGTGVFGIATATTDTTTYGVYGQSDSTRGFGVFGTATSATGFNSGVRGETFSTNGRGVFGEAFATTGVTYGGRFESASTSGLGVFGEATASTGTTYGGRFQSASTSGVGVHGWATANSGSADGVFGRSSSIAGRGVFGDSTASTGTTYGVYGKSASTAGRGVFGFASSPSGTTFGVRGQTNSPSGYAGYFTGGRNYFEGNVGIGTANPSLPLHIVNSSGQVGIMHDGQDAAFASIYTNAVQSTAKPTYGYLRQSVLKATTYVATDDSLRLQVASADRVTIEASGDVGIGTTSPQDKLHLGEGQIRIDADNTSSTSGGGLELRRLDNNSGTVMNIFALRNQDGTLKASSHYGFMGDRLYITNNGGGNTTGVYLAVGGNSWTSSSDERLKERIRNVTYGLDDVLALRPRDFVWKENGLVDTGFIAQEVHKVFPQAVSTTPDNEVGWGVDYAKLTPLLVAGIQELASTVEAKDAEIDLLKERLSALESVVERLASEQKGSAR